MSDTAEVIAQRRKEGRPQMTAAEARVTVDEVFGVDAALVTELDSYDDRNFYVRAVDGREFAMKVHNVVEEDAILECQNEMMLHLSKKGILCPQPNPSKAGLLLEHVTLMLLGGEPGRHGIRLLSWVPGRLMHDLPPLSDRLLDNAGGYLASLTTALSDFAHPAAARNQEWDLRHTGNVAQHIPLLSRPGYPHPHRADFVRGVLDEFEEVVFPAFREGKALRQSVLMGDFNDANVIVSPTSLDYCATVTCWEHSPCATHEEVKLVGLIDFGDTVRSFSVCELAIGVMYIMVNIAGQLIKSGGDRSTILSKAAIFYAGYIAKGSLSAVERRLLLPLVLCRLAMSCMYGLYSQSKDPTNEYLKMHSEPAWLALEVVYSTPRSEVEAVFEKADSRRRRQEAKAQ